MFRGFLGHFTAFDTGERSWGLSCRPPLILEAELVQDPRLGGYDQKPVLGAS